jgi:putative heme transporter
MTFPMIALGTNVDGGAGLGDMHDVERQRDLGVESPVNDADSLDQQVLLERLVNLPLASPKPIETTLHEATPQRVLPHATSPHATSPHATREISEASSHEIHETVLHETIEPESVAATRAPRPWMRWVSIAFFVIVLAGLTLNRSLIADLSGELHQLSVASMVSLVAFVLFHRLVHATMHRLSIPGLKLRHSLLATEAYVGASNAVVGGATVGTGLRIAMYRSWGVRTEQVALSIFATALAPSFAMWSLAAAYTWPLLLTGSADHVQRFTALAAVCFLVAPGAFWWLALRRPEPLQWVAKTAQRLRTRAIAFVPSERLSDRIDASRAGRLDLGVSIEDLRMRANELGRGRRVGMYLCAMAGQLAMAATLLGCVRALGPTGSAIDTIAVLRAFALLRVLSSFVPIPGGLGVLDVGLLGVLTSGGVARPTALAAIALYRGLTFVVPMLTGPICAAVWRASQKRRVQRDSVSAVETGALGEALAAA